MISGFGWIADLDEYDSEDVTLITLHLLLCIEMVIVAFAQVFVFPASEFDCHPASEKQKDYEAL